MNKAGQERIEMGSDDPEMIVWWFHGLGADGTDFVSLADFWHFDCRTRYVFPHAPHRPVTWNGGITLRAWYDIIRLDPDAEDESGIRSAVSAVHAALDEERAMYPHARLFIGGFSQGGALALAAGLRYQEPLAGIVGLSTYLPLASKTESERHMNNQDTPIFLAHGQFDPVVPLGLGWAARDQLLAWHHGVTFKTYWMMHQVIPQELEEIGDWLTSNAALG